MLNSYVIPILLYGSEYWTASPLKLKDVLFYRRMFRIPWMWRVNNWEVLKEIQTEKIKSEREN